MPLVTLQDGATAHQPDDAHEVVFYGTLPMKAWKNLLGAYLAKGVIDLAAGSGEACKAALLLRKPCLGFCFNDAHKLALFDHLVDWMLGCMEDQSTTFINAAYKTWKTTGSASSSQIAKSPAAIIERKRSRSKGSGKDPKKNKKHKKKESSSSSSSSD